MKRISIPSDDVYTYEKQALDMLSPEHPHYHEVYQHLYNQIYDQKHDIRNTQPARRTDTTREDTDFARTQET